LCLNYSRAGTSDRTNLQSQSAWELFLFVFFDKLSLFVFCGLETKWTLVVSGFGLVVGIIAKHWVLNLAADTEEVLVVASICMAKVSLRLQRGLQERSKQDYVQIHVLQTHMMEGLFRVPSIRLGLYRWRCCNKRGSGSRIGNGDRVWEWYSTRSVYGFQYEKGARNIRILRVCFLCFVDIVSFCNVYLRTNASCTYLVLRRLFFTNTFVTENFLAI